MKKSILFMASSLLLLASCNNTLPEEYQEATGGDKVITLSLGGEFVSTSEKPLTPMAYTRAAVNTATPGKTLYAVNVTKEDAGKQEHPFAYGLFDDPAKMKIYLGAQSGNTLHFYVSTVTEEGDKLHQVAGSYAEPFVLTNTNNAEVTNRFIRSTTVAFQDLKSGSAMVVGNPGEKLLSNPRLGRFYGEATKQLQGPNKITLPIDLKYAVFGLKFNIIPPQKGTATITFLGRTITVKDSDASNYSEEYVYSFKDIHAAATAVGTHEEVVPVNINWTGGNNPAGVKQEVNVTAKRKVMTTLNIDFSSTNDSDIQLNMEDKTMTEIKQDITVTE